jgi:membrane fusion protein, multidrug efflux system
VSVHAFSLFLLRFLVFTINGGYFTDIARKMVRASLRKMVNGLTAWMRRHLLLSTVLGIFLAYAVYEVVTTFAVVCRDAYVATDIVVVAPEVSGPMLSLEVSNDQVVQTGALLFTIDPKPFQIELNRQKANLQLAQANLMEARDRLGLTQSDIKAKQATLDEASKNQERGLELQKNNVLSQEAVDNLQRSFQLASAALNQSRAAQVVAEQAITVQADVVKQVETEVARAEYELSRTKIRSPVNGRVAPFQLRPGSFLEAGKSVLAIVTADNWRVVANLTERHLSGLAVGQRVWFMIGSDPWRVHAGRVRSIAPGISRSATAVNVLPYVEPTTEWIRLPRRFPVEIDIGDLPKNKRLFTGANATVWWIGR